MGIKRVPTVKHCPEDFRVEERSARVPDGGPYALYRLTKRGLGTPEAIAAVVRRWNLARRQVSFGGLKDRHALTQQWLTIHHGPRRDLKQTHLELVYVGQTSAPFRPADIAGNAFEIVLRDLSDDGARRAQQILQRAARDGVPNYFDQQRFGSVGQSREFIARAWCQGDYRRALWLAMADPNPHDRPRDKAEKKFLREHWGDWPQCRAALRRSPWRKVLALLASRPDDERGAWAQVPAELRGIYLAAFQSFLWNRMLAALLRQTCRAEQLFQLFWGVDTLCFYRALDDDQRRQLAESQLPLPSARQHLLDGPLKELTERVLGGLELRQEDLRVDGPRESFFAKGLREAIYRPADLTLQAGRDEVYPDRQKIVLRFQLPRGCYATILLRGLAEGNRA
jgi:tRNA pseudouridine13 synthase